MTKGCETCWTMTKFYRNPDRAPACRWCVEADPLPATPAATRRARAARRTPTEASRRGFNSSFAARGGKP